MVRLFLGYIIGMATSLPLAASCPEGHISCEEASRLNGAAASMGVMTGTATPILTCEEATT